MIGGGHDQFGRYIAAVAAIYKFVASSRGLKREGVREYFSPVYGGTPGISVSTKLFTKIKENSVGLNRMEIPTCIDPTSVVRKSAERNGYCYTEDNHVIYRGISITKRRDR